MLVLIICSYIYYYFLNLFLYLSHQGASLWYRKVLAIKYISYITITFQQFVYLSCVPIIIITLLTSLFQTDKISVSFFSTVYSTSKEHRTLKHIMWYIVDIHINHFPLTKHLSYICFPILKHIICHLKS